MSTTPVPQPLPPPNFPWFDPKTGLPTLAFAQYMASLDAAIRVLCGKI